MSVNGFVPLDAPLPTRRTDDLLAVSKPLVPADATRWLGGVWSGGYPPGPAFTHDPCSHGTDRVKMDAGSIASQQSGRFTVYMPASCTTQSVASDVDGFIARLKAAFAIYESAAVERALASGDTHEDIGPYIGNQNMELLANGAVDAIAALRLLENTISRHGSGIIHAAPSTVVVWDALNLTMRRGPLTYTKRGTPIAVGAGYINITPDNQNAPGVSEQWVFATGPVEIYRSSEIVIPASAMAQILDRSQNDVFVIVERPYFFNWLGRQSSDDEDHVQAGVLVNESAISAVPVIDGGSC